MSMEVKIKDGDMLIDATVEVENGVMLIIPKAPLSKKEKKEKWTPKNGERFYYPTFMGKRFYSDTAIESEIMSVTKWGEYKRGWVFKTKEECQLICDKLNAAIAYVTL